MHYGHKNLASLSPRECSIQTISTRWFSTVQENFTWLGWDPICAIHLMKKWKSSIDAEWVKFDLFVLNFGLFHYFEGRECGWLHTIADWRSYKLRDCLSSAKSQKDCSGWQIIFCWLLVSQSNLIVLTFLHNWKYFSSKLPPQLTLSYVLDVRDFWTFISNGGIFFFREAVLLAGGRKYYDFLFRLPDW